MSNDSTKVDREYILESSMLGYFAADGARNPTLKANKGDRVRIKIINAELMTHDIALEKMAVKSEAIIEKGSSTSITFVAEYDDTYYCSIPGHKLAGMVGKFEVVEGDIAVQVIAGYLPMQNGKSLNLNFETGDLTDWKVEGDAFSKGLISEDPSPLHEKDMRMIHEGNYFLSSGGIKEAKLTGTLTSVPFKVTHPFAAFLLSGGALEDTRVELVDALNNRVFFQITGQGRATLQPVVVDLQPYLNKDIFIRIIDHETGLSTIPYVPHDKWAHINFDDFRFYDSRPDFSNELKKEDIIVLPPLDPVLHAGLSGREAAAAMTVPKGFKVTLAAAEPAIVRPICFTIDNKGRLWVVEGHTYPIPAAEGEGKDRILIFEDTDGDGTLDSRKVFAENLNLVSGIEVGMGGVWLGAAPYLLFIPLDAKNDKPAGPAQKLLDGWGVQDTHEVLNSLRWGPDGWLYGTHGIFTHSNVGKPGAPDSERKKINAGVWRYHPVRHTFEVFAEGSSNPWGIDFNQYGHPFITVCVIPHMYHIIQGARYHRQAGNHFNPYTYDDIKTIGDHVHWVGDRGPHAGNFRSAAQGGGHAHSGAMIYQGGNSWPEHFRNKIFMNNINGARLNIDKLSRRGSGYVASHEEDFMVMNDSWSQWLNMRYDQNGSVYSIDWYDKNQCHSKNPDVHDKTLGRIFKITYQQDQWKKVDLSKEKNSALVNYHLHENEWYVRHARTLLQERGINKKNRKDLRTILNTHPEETKRLRALWTLHVTNSLSQTELLELLQDKGEYIRSWAVQLLTENKSVSSSVLTQFENLAQHDSSPLVQLYLTSAMTRLRPEQRWGVIEALISRKIDSSDHNLPLLLWYAAEPLADLDPKRALQLVEKSSVPIHQEYMMKRIAAIETNESKKALLDFSKRSGKRLSSNDPVHQGVSSHEHHNH